MNTEIEAKFVQVDHDEIRKKLKSAGATCQQPMRTMQRVIIETPELKSKNAYIRIRHEGDKISVTYKQFDEASLSGTKEIEITASDFEKTVAIFEATGLPHRSFQESRRETWQLNGAEIVLDEWPWLDPYIEIEGSSEESVKKTATILNLDWDQAVFGGVMAAYKAQYPHLQDGQTIGRIKEVRFGDPLPELLDPNN